MCVCVCVFDLAILVPVQSRDWDGLGFTLERQCVIDFYFDLFRSKAFPLYVVLTDNRGNFQEKKTHTRFKSHTANGNTLVLNLRTYCKL